MLYVKPKHRALISSSEFQAIETLHGRGHVIVEEWPKFTRQCTGAIVWDNAWLMIRHLEGMGRRNMHKKTMVDLGCGTGVVGICAGVLGANVLLTDMDHALDLPRRNQARNLQAIKAGGGKVESAVHVWGSDVAPLLASLGGKQAQQPVDFVVACEVVYQPESYPSLVKSISDLSGPKTVVRDRENPKQLDDLELFDCHRPQIGDISIGARPRFFSPCGGGTTQRLTHSLR